MIYTYSIYDTATGRFTGIHRASDQGSITSNVDAGYSYVEGEYDIKTQMVVNGEVVDVPSDTVDSEKSDAAMEEIRGRRDEFLSSSDWTQMPDSPLTDAKKQEWATYRQALRDLPANTTDPINPVWPTKPE